MNASLQVVEPFDYNQIPNEYAAPDQEGRTPSKYQQRVLWRVDVGRENIVVNAVAGSGKTSLIEMTIARLVERAIRNGRAIPTMLIVAFNKKIQIALSNVVAKLQKRFPNVRLSQFITVKTLNAFGYGIVSKHVKGSMKPDEANKTYNTLFYRFFPDLESEDKETRQAAEKKFNLFYPPMIKLVDLFRAHAFTEVPTREVVEEFSLKYDINLPNGGSEEEFDTMLRACYKRVIDNLNSIAIDWNDQVFQPVYRKWAVPQFDFVIVDESQDLSPVQIALVRNAAQKIGSRSIFVGDRHQAIYGFRGADDRAIDSIIELYNAVELPLSICYRCCKAAIRKAQAIVPHIEAHPDNPEGICADVTIQDMRKRAEAGDFVLCRTTAPLVQEALAFIREGRAAYVLGKDIGRNLSALADQIYGKYIALRLPMTDAVEKHRNEKGEKLAQTKRQTELDKLNDQCDTLMAILATCENNIHALRKAIDAIFSDENESRAVVFSTIHKAKGLERKRVWIICPELLPHPNATQDWQVRQEKNLEYVAYTRAQLELYIVKGKPGERPNALTPEQREAEEETQREIARRAAY